MEEALESIWRRKADTNRIGKECTNAGPGEQAKLASAAATTTAELPVKNAAGRRLRQSVESSIASAGRVGDEIDRLSSVSVTGGHASDHSKKVQQLERARRDQEVVTKTNYSRQQVVSKEIKSRLPREQIAIGGLSRAAGARDSNNNNVTKEESVVCSSRSLNALIDGHKSWSKKRTIIVDIKNGRQVLDKSISAHSQVSHSTTRGASLNDSLNPVLNEENQIVDRQHKEQEDSERKSVTLAAKSVQQNNKSSGGKQADGAAARKDLSLERPAGDKSSRQPIEEQDRDSKPAQGSTNPENNKQEEANNRQQIEEKKAEARRAEEAQLVGKRPPTFGTVPHKLSRLPYFSYYGKARNVDLISAADRSSAAANHHHHQQRTGRNNKSGSEESSASSTIASSTSSSQRSLNSLAPISRILTPIRSIGQQRSIASGQTHSGGATVAARRRSGYSNISNLFPGQPMNESRRESSAGRRQYSIRFGSEERERQTSGIPTRSKRPQSSSAVNLSNQQQPQHSSGRTRSGEERTSRIASSATGRRNSANNLGSGSSGYATARNRSLNSLYTSPVNQPTQIDPAYLQTSGMRRQNSSSYNSKQRAAQTLYQGRPSSVAGYLGRHHRSPSTSSLHYGSAGLSPYGPAALPIDPDCPVHGYSPVNGASALQSKSSHNLAVGPLEAPDLLYEPYPNYYERPVGARQGSLYSPTSPPLIDGSRTISKGRVPAATLGNGDAYYNSASRFSMYHSPSVVDGARSSLAPPNEQLRRILGYQPHARPIHLHPQWAYSRPFIHLQGTRSPSPSAPLDSNGDPEIQPQFEPYNQLIDTQAIRAVDFHPSGEVYAIGSNSRALRICAYPADYELRHFGQEHVTSAPRILFKFLQVHRGSIYCVAFNTTGQLLATGSNDQTVHIVRYNSTTHSPDGDEYRLTMHDGTVRDICFIDDQTNGSSILLSAGGGDNKIYVTDCDTITPFQSMAGHTQMVMALHHWSGANFVSASQDKTIRFWDLRTRACTSIISAPPSGAGPAGVGITGKLAGPGAPVCSVKVDPSGRLLASGHSDSTCMLYDIRGARIIQAFKPHDDEIRTVSFSPKSYYLLTGGYDGRIVLTDLQGDLTQPLPQCCVAESDDKIVQSKWHPSDFTFVTTSADKTATLWAMPTE